MGILAGLCLLAPVHAQVDPAFDDTVAPVLGGRCLECHSGPKPQGGLDLTRRRSAIAGGESGPAVVAGKPDDSLLWQKVRDGEMPPKAKLTDKEKATLRNWIAGGARWGTEPIDPFRLTTAQRAGYDWWSLKPVRNVVVPTIVDADQSLGAVDRFVLAGLNAKGLRMAPPADRRTLIRRLAFDLTGLPPTPEEIAAFEADTSDDAFAKLVDRLLASPHYGERQARHWLDVVRFGESNGFERDLPRETAWHYRNWVIDALNRDLPYDEFVRLQIAGDVLRPADAGAIVATGFLVAGPHDTVLPSSDRMRAAMAQDELEELIGTVGQTFLGLTVNCARCHDHKFDPIPQADYYRLAAALAGVRHGERDLVRPGSAAEVVRLRREVETLRRKLEAIEEPARRAASSGSAPTPAAPRAVAEWDFRTGLKDAVGTLHGSVFGAARTDAKGLALDGMTAFVASEPLAADLRAKTLEAWVSAADLKQRGGGVIGVESLDGAVFDTVVFAEREAGRWMAGSDHFRRTDTFAGPEETEAAKRPVHVAIVWHADGTVACFRDGRAYGRPYKSKGPVLFRAGAARVIFGVRHEPAGGNRMFAGTLQRAKLYDRALSPEEVAASAGVRETAVTEAQLLAKLSADDRARREEIVALIAAMTDVLKRTESAQTTKVYAALSAQPEPTHVLIRGNVTEPAQRVSAAGLVCAGAADFDLPPDAPEGARRARLAAWITRPDNPLFARVIVNRLWQWHFGTGIVDTAGDFGFNGGRPSHPELLDWLAGDLVRSGWSLKAMHRTLVLSAAYRQSSTPAREATGPDPRTVDADNRLLWKRNPVRLEAESLRDAMLAVSGTLDRGMGGRGYLDFRSHFFKGTQFYDPLPQVGPQFRRRTIYRMWARGGRSPFLDVFDCPDPSAAAQKRAVTTTPLQALALMNNAFALDMADAFAARLAAEAGADIDRQVERAFALALARSPTPAERERIKAFVSSHGLPALTRVLLASNEFLHVD